MSFRAPARPLSAAPSRAQIKGRWKTIDVPGNQHLRICIATHIPCVVVLMFLQFPGWEVSNLSRDVKTLYIYIYIYMFWIVHIYIYIYVLPMPYFLPLRVGLNLPSHELQEFQHTLKAIVCISIGAHFS